MRRSSFLLIFLLTAACVGSVDAPVTLSPQKSANPAPLLDTRGATPTIKAKNASMSRVDSVFAATLRPAFGNAPIVALLLPLTGKDKGIGQSMQDAALLALNDAGQSNIQLRPYDTQSNPARAATLAEKAVSDGAQLIVGPLFAAEARAARDATRASNTPLITFSNDRTLANDGSYVLGIMPQDQIARLIQHSVTSNKRRFAILVPDNAFGEIMRSAAEEIIGRSGGTLVISERLGAGSEAQTAALKKLGQRAAKEGYGAGFDALVMPLSGAELRSVAPLLAVNGIDTQRVKLLGLSSWDDPKTLGEPSLQGAWFAAAPRKMREQFESNYSKLYGKSPIRQASLAYDATALAIVISRSNNGQFSESWLKNASGYAGIDGIFRFTPQGISERSLSVFEISGQGTKEISPAASRFESSQAQRR
ncbi:MAG: penicillin-binding protein activator [Alphaproteobacteria bacterium]|jgi:branched-chain amino acid transport system substrate-binding protein|nr:penicillin-binding protein activator [Alphaproteobacteria bacterium]